ncbi:hypothetical protein MIN45_P2216 [Methylomarinovum tepidoasis]|uniref:HDOD domain-containing protein n=1 Tax=Methylomarinovum tepidoasis TaxID=2840183 RepID=A0AAU9CHS4_9GAMM|nr:HDOD domain-containing protein [Methylomarinovum sp. IN45]BCX89843.1 hypothetical protein MIN45_P2216 [Methylomarinovum sp. IN45]
MNHTPPNSWETGLDIDSLLRGDVQLASSPEIYRKLCQIIEDPRKTVRDAEQVIEHDPGVSARLLRLVNSAFYGFPRQIVSIAHAISLIGMEALRQLVLATTVIERFGRYANPLMEMRVFWHMSVWGALLARELGRHSRMEPDLEPLFVCGLLHEIGRLVIYAKIPELARAALLLAEGGAFDETEAERLTYGFDHYQLAAELARRWQLPQVIVTTLAWHGRPEEAEDFREQTAIVTASLVLSRNKVLGLGIEKLPPHYKEWLALAAVSDAALEQAQAQADEQFDAVSNLLLGS